MSYRYRIILYLCLLLEFYSHTWSHGRKTYNSVLHGPTTTPSLFLVSLTTTTSDILNTSFSDCNSSSGIMTFFPSAGLLTRINCLVNVCSQKVTQRRSRLVSIYGLYTATLHWFRVFVMSCWLLDDVLYPTRRTSFSWLYPSGD